MFELAVSEEIYKGISDLPIVFISLILAILIANRAQKKPNIKKRINPWRISLLLIAFAAYLGAGVHMYVLNSGLKKAIWLVLYALLYEIIRRVITLLSGYVSKGRLEYPKNYFRMEIAGFVISAVLLLLGNPYDIYVFVAFALLNAFWFIKNMKKYIVPNRVRLLLVLGGLAIVSQGMKSVIPYGVVIGHIMIYAALIVFYLISKDAVK